MAAKQKQQSKQAKAKTPATKSKSAALPELTQTFLPGFWKDNWMPLAILMAMAFGLYSASIAFGYMLDDQMVIWANVYVQKGFAGLGDIFAYDSFMGYFQKQQFLLEGGRYRPLSLATFAVEIGIFGKDNPNLIHISHFVNILLYGATGMLLYRILLGLFPLKEGGRWYFGVPFLASAIFVLHPLHSECIANIKGRDEILALLGGLGALYATLKYFDTRRSLWLILSGVFLLLGMLAKENALTFIAVIPLTVYFFTNVANSRNFSAGLVLFLAGIVFMLIRFKALGYMFNHGTESTDLMNNPFYGMTGGERLATIFLTLGWYLKLLFVPHPLTHDYYPYHVPKVGWSDWRALLSLGLYLAMGIWAVMNLKKRKVPAYTILFYLFTLSIVSNLFVSVGTFMNERFVYMPSVAICILLGWFFARKLPELIKEDADKPSILGAMVVLVVGGLFAVRTYTRVPDWKDPMSLNKVAVQVSENSARSHCYYVTALYKDQYVNEKDPAIKKALVDTMEYHINRSLQINPNYGAALIMEGAVAAARFDLDHQLDKFFHVMEYILEKIPYNPNFRDFLDKYMDYLNGANAEKYMAFCHRVGYDFFFKKKNDLKTAEKFLIYGLNRQYEDIRILDDLTEVYTAMGNPAKAAEMKARADAQRY